MSADANTDMSARIVCIGAAHVDRTARALGPVALGSSNPVAMRSSVGGVACNAARVAARLGATVAFIGLAGDDEAGRTVRAALRSEGVDTARLASAEGATATYTAFLDEAGDLVVALADMGLYDRIGPEAIDDAADLLDECAVWFADANLPVETLGTLSRAWGLRVARWQANPSGTRRPTLVLDAVSVAKAARTRDIACDLRFMGRDEARVVYPNLDLGQIAREEARRGGTAIVTFGAEGCLAIGQPFGIGGSFHQHAIRAAPAALRDVTGAGDALIGAVLARLAAGPRRKEGPGGEIGHAIAEALEEGVVAAAFAVEETGSVPTRLTRAALRERLAHARGDLRFAETRAEVAGRFEALYRQGAV